MPARAGVRCRYAPAPKTREHVACDRVSVTRTPEPREHVAVTGFVTPAPKTREHVACHRVFGFFGGTLSRERAAPMRKYSIDTVLRVRLKHRPGQLAHLA